MSGCSKELYDYVNNGGYLHDPNISLADFYYYAYGSSTPPSMFAPLKFPERECKPLQRTRSRAHIQRLIEDF